MRTQQRRPMVEMLRRYWMLPYHAPSFAKSSSDEGDGGGGSVSLIGDSSERRGKIRVS